jgi:hypothetical protein
VLVEYGPGGCSPAHTHAKSAFICATVLEGAIRSQVNDGPVTTCEAGQSFSELGRLAVDVAAAAAGVDAHGGKAGRVSLDEPCRTRAGDPLVRAWTKELAWFAPGRASEDGTAGPAGDCP